MAEPNETPRSLLATGEVIAGKYRIERVIGRGGMAEVYAAHHEILQQTVALKVLLPSIAESKEASARFLNEARSAARIRGEHVATVMDVGTLPSGAAYMVLEYLEGDDLEAYADKHAPLPPSEAVDYVLDALQAIAQAHALGIIHRDLKPSNLFLARRPDGSTVVKVLDFGISKGARSPGASIDAHATASQVILGSPYYMAPEQARSAKSVDPRADIWAVGVILHRLLTGALPLVGETLTELLLAIVTDEPPPIRQLRPDLPEELEAIVLRCLRKNPAERFANVAELASALKPFASKEAGAAIKSITRTLAVSTPARVLTAPAFSSPAPAAGTGPGTTSPWAESSAARAEKRSRAARVRAFALGAIALGAVLGTAIVVVSWRAKDSQHSGSAGNSGVTVEPAPPPSLPSVTLPPAEPSDSVPAPSASASTPSPAASAAPASSPRAVGTPSRGSSAAPRPVGKPAPSSGYDLLNQRN
ncbi:MAG TPA: protein kinase [Polyangiaceae bacterium]